MQKKKNLEILRKYEEKTKRFIAKMLNLIKLNEKNCIKRRKKESEAHANITFSPTAIK